MFLQCTTPKEHFFRRTASTKPRKPNRLVMTPVSQVLVKGIMSHSWTLDPLQYAQEKHCYAMSKVSIFSMQ